MNDAGMPDGDQQAPPAPPRRRVAVIGLAVVGMALGWGAWIHWQQAAQARQTQTQLRDDLPELRVTTAQRDARPIVLKLPGETVAFDIASIYARATGYIAERRVDIGSRVHRGDLLVRIAAPDLDQQLVQARAQLGQNQAAVLQSRANLAQAQANTNLAGVTKYRQTTLASQGWESRQNADNSTANFSVQNAGVQSAQAGIAVAVANLNAQQATVDRLRALASYEQVAAPFDGVVTARNVDTGDLVQADNGGGSPMFQIERDSVLRVTVDIPQDGATGVIAGLPARVIVPELGGRTLHATVSRAADALVSSSRTMQTEVDVQNPDGALRPGMFVDIEIEVPRQNAGVVVPDEALVFNQDGLHVDVVRTDHTIEERRVSIYRDFGTSAELAEGLQGGETLVVSPPADLATGAKIKVQ